MTVSSYRLRVMLPYCNFLSKGYPLSGAILIIGTSFYDDKSWNG